MELDALGQVVTGLGCMISVDGDRTGGPKAGNFQHHSDIANLLICLGDMIESKAELVSIANNAQWKLGQVNGATR